MEKRIIVTETCKLFPVFTKVIKQIAYPQESVMIAVTNQMRSQSLKTSIKDKFKFVFDCQDENQCGVEVFQIIEGE